MVVGCLLCVVCCLFIDGRCELIVVRCSSSGVRLVPFVVFGGLMSCLMCGTRCCSRVDVR